jgi:hypothetical protein
MHLSGLSPTLNLEGNILPGFDQDSTHNKQAVYTIEAKSNSKFKPITHGSIAMIKSRYKLIHYLGYKENIPDELYDLHNDPEELENRYLDKKSIYKGMISELTEKLDGVNQDLFG